MSHLPIQIRSETLADIDAIDAVTVAAFLQAPHTSHTEQLIIHALRNAGQLAVSLVALVEGIVIGHVAASPVSIADGSPGWFGLGPLSVLPAHQNRGAGSSLMRGALSSLRQKAAAGCVLLGEPKYYGRFGFRVDPLLTLPGVPAEYFQALSFGINAPRGIVSYHDAFKVIA